MFKNPRRLTGRVATGLLAFAAAISLAACSSSAASSTPTSTAASGASSGSAASSTQTSTAASGGSSGVSSSAAAFNTAYTGITGTPPTAAAAPKAGIHAWVVSCGQQVPTCAGPAQAAVDAAKAAGWDATICDGKLNPQGWSACIRQGISAKAGGIIVIGQDCNSMQAALQEAKTANIPTVAGGGNDCDVSGGPKLFSGVVTNLPSLTAQQWWEKLGALQADWMIGKTDSKAQVLSLQFTDAIWGPWIQQGFAKELAACTGCKVLDTIKIANADVASGQLPQKFSTALLKVPTANAVNVPLDGWFFAGLSQAVQSSGKADKLAVIGSFGEPGNLDLIRNGTGEDATVGFSASWSGWAAVDVLARVLDSQPVQPAGIGLQVIDAQHNMPASGPFQYSPPIDYAAAYKKAWGAA